MIESNDSGSVDGESEPTDIQAIYGFDLGESLQEISVGKKSTDFQPWHLPVKQLVRSWQWKELVNRLLDDRPEPSSPLRYFTLPGRDLFDIRVLSDVCEPRGIQIEYFGFDQSQTWPTGESDSDDQNPQVAPWVTAESALRQADRITDSAVIHSDRLEDIAIAGSNAAAMLRDRMPFDVVNMDACEHLAYVPTGRSYTTFHALQSLLRHQLSAEHPWLLFITTRVDADLLGPPSEAFRRAIDANISAEGSDFSSHLADCLGVPVDDLIDAMKHHWANNGVDLMKLYSVGLGKYLLQYFHAQANHPAAVELISSFVYRVHASEPDMAAIAFRITPSQLQIQEPTVGGTLDYPSLEMNRAKYIAQRASKVFDADHALSEPGEALDKATAEMRALLSDANYDVDAWDGWVNGHPRKSLLE